MSLVRGIDQRRLQISAEWIETITGEILRARIAPADRAGVRKFLARFKGADLGVAVKLPAAAREQHTIALSMIDAIDLRLSPFDLSLRDYARKPARLPRAE